MLKWLVLVAWILFGVYPAAADRASEKLTDNPAFCFGYLSAQSQKQSDILLKRKMSIRTLFAKRGPKDSTDERGFDDWEKVGRDAAANPNFLQQCRRLLEERSN